jgi:hypothetical protein
MGLVDKVFHLLGKLLMERPARDKSLADLREELQVTGREAQQHLDGIDDTSQNREALRHVIAIERWGQRRLEVALGEPLVMDESDEYTPAEDVGWDRLQEAFRETRQKTVTLARKLDEEGVDHEQTVPHNQWGDLSVHGWLYYLNFHANRDVKQL